MKGGREQEEAEISASLLWVRERHPNLARSGQPFLPNLFPLCRKGPEPEAGQPGAPARCGPVHGREAIPRGGGGGPPPSPARAAGGTALRGAPPGGQLSPCPFPHVLGALPKDSSSCSVPLNRVPSIHGYEEQSSGKIRNRPMKTNHPLRLPTRGFHGTSGEAGTEHSHDCKAPGLNAC